MKFKTEHLTNLVNEANKLKVSVWYYIIDAYLLPRERSKLPYPSNLATTEQGPLYPNRIFGVVHRHAGKIKIALKNQKRLNEEQLAHLNGYLHKARNELKEAAKEQLEDDIAEITNVVCLPLSLLRLSTAANKGYFGVYVTFMSEGVPITVKVAGRVKDRFASIENVANDKSGKLVLSYRSVAGKVNTIDADSITDIQLKTTSKRFAHEHLVTFGVVKKLLGVK